MGILESLRAQSRLKILVLGLALSALAQAQEPLLAIGKWLPQGVANVRVSSDGRYLLVMPHYYEDPDRNLELWRVSDGQRIAELHQKAQHLSAGFAPDPPFDASDLDGDSIECRLYHLTAASIAPDVHCPHIGVTSVTCF